MVHNDKLYVAARAKSDKRTNNNLKPKGMSGYRTAKEHIESKGVCEHDYMETGMIDHIANMMEEYLSGYKLYEKNLANEDEQPKESCHIQNVSDSSPKIHIIDVDGDILESLNNMGHAIKLMYAINDDEESKAHHYEVLIRDER